MGGRLPDFQGVGVQKGGTTTLQRLLEQHPGAFLPPTKEIHYFSLHYVEGEAWYGRQFAAARLDQRCGEITPYYLFHPEAPARIQRLLPQVRLIVLLRDPVERALSQVFHSRRLGLEPLELEPALEAEAQRLAGAEAVLMAVDGRHRSHQEHSYVARSRYLQQLERYEALFAPEQLLVLRSEDLFSASERIWERIQAFLGLAAMPLPAPLERANAGQGEAADVAPAIRQRLRAELAATVSGIRRRYGFDWGW